MHQILRNTDLADILLQLLPVACTKYIKNTDLVVILLQMLPVA
jgi:hypothetical protein